MKPYIIIQSVSSSHFSNMANRGRPRRNPDLFSVEDWIEYTSDSDSDSNNVHHNMYNIVHGSLQSIQPEDEVMAMEAQEAPIELAEPFPGHPQQEAPFEFAAEQFHGYPQQEAPIELAGEPFPGHPQQEAPIELAPEPFHGYPQQEPPIDLPEPFHNQHEVYGEMEQVQANEVDHQQNEAIQQVEANGVGEQLQQILFQALADSDQEMEDLEEEEEEEDQEGVGEYEDYESILNELNREWLLAEIDHSVSKTASEIFWKIGLKFFPKLNTAMEREKKKKTSQFQTIRKNMYTDLLPPINIEIAYKHRESGETEIVNETNTPIKQFPPSKFEKLYEIGTVKVTIEEIHLFNLHLFFPITLTKQ